MLTILVRFAPMDHAITKRHLHDLGKLLFALVMLWAYMNFAQLLITWSGNLPEEVVWYIKRWNGGWGGSRRGLSLHPRRGLNSHRFSRSYVFRWKDVEWLRGFVKVPLLTATVEMMLLPRIRPPSGAAVMLSGAVLGSVV